MMESGPDAWSQGFSPHQDVSVSPVRRVCSTARRVSTWIVHLQNWVRRLSEPYAETEFTHLKTLTAISMRRTHDVASALRAPRSSVSLPLLTASYRVTASRTSLRQLSSSRNAALTSSGSGAESSGPCLELEHSIPDLKENNLHFVPFSLTCVDSPVWRHGD